MPVPNGEIPKKVGSQRTAGAPALRAADSTASQPASSGCTAGTGRKRGSREAASSSQLLPSVGSRQNSPGRWVTQAEEGVDVDAHQSVGNAPAG